MNQSLLRSNTTEGDNERRTRLIGYGIALTIVLVVFVWGSLAPLQSAAIAPGVVQVEGKRKAIQHLEGGILAQILVANGEWVEVDQPLLILDVARYVAERDILQGRLYNQQAAADRLQSERDDLPDVLFRDSLVEAGFIDDRAANAMSNEMALFAARSADRTAEEEVLASRQKGLKLLVKSKQSVEESLRQEITDLRELLADGYVDKQRLRQLERSRTEIIGELADLQVSIEEVSLRVSQLRTRFKKEVVDELALTLEELYDIKQKFSAADDAVQRSTIRSPVAGTVLNLIPNTIGAVIGSGETVLEIVPSIDRLVVDARVAPMDIDRVSVGQDAEVRFSVFKDAYLISGSLTKLSPDRLVDQETNLPYYSAEIKLVEEDLSLLRGMTLVPGMPAEVLIKTGERTMLGYITSPMRRGLSRSLTED
ncbi:MAG: HlyD family type I secretion periplasmic adaptor subunit [Proteobacteria bacterium]|nr:HlyD family type I secretion periplasmic adaptor subunit [Pseudomonadota bacterium]